MAAIALCGCQNMELDEQVPVQKVFTATIEDNDLSTKTSLDEYGNVLWKAGDQVSVFVASTINQQYQVTDASDGQTSASLNPVSSPGFMAGGEIPNNVAFYPYSSSNTIAKNATGYVVSTALPSTQNYAEASFGNGSFPMAAVTTSTTDMNLKFKNVLGGLKLQLKGTASIASISVTGNNDEPLCGAAAVSLSTTSTPTINLTDASAKTVTLDCASGVQLNESTATPFVIALPPMTMTGGFTVVVTDTEGKEMEIKTTRSQTITRSSILRMPEVNYEGVAPAPAHEYIDLGLSVKWATMNVGATKPEEYGDYFAWAATEPLYELGYAQEDPQAHWMSGKTDGYRYVNTPYQTVNTMTYSSTKWTKYIGDATSSYKDPSAADADAVKIVLDPEDDAAHINWRGDWRMPTEAEFDELRNTDNCTWTWTTLNGVSGYKVQSKKSGYTDNWIFLPAAGYRSGSSLNDVGSEGRYWSSSQGAAADCARQMRLFSSGVNWYTSYNSYRYLGLSVRPVCSNDPSAGITGISLNKSSMSMYIGDVETIVAIVSKNAGAINDQVEWSSSNSSVAKVDRNGTVTAISTGTVTITAKTVFGGFTAACTVLISNPDYNGYEYVDLGLSVKWATVNVGATTPEGYGDYFAWGETNPKSEYSWSTYLYCNGTGSTLTKYCDNKNYGYNGFKDNIAVLSQTDDAARVNWGGSWRMPSSDELKELRNSDNCTWTRTTLNGVAGYKVQSKKSGYTNNWIFLPVAGSQDNSKLYSDGSVGYYWSNTVGSDIGKAFLITFSRYSATEITNYYRYYGYSIRPVTK